MIGSHAEKSAVSLVKYTRDRCAVIAARTIFTLLNQAGTTLNLIAYLDLTCVM